MPRPSAYSKKAAEAEGPGVYVLPEYALTLMPKDAAAIVAQAQPVPGPMTERFSEIAKRRNLWVAAGMLETSATPGKPYNCIALLGPAGQVLRYRKTHLWDNGPASAPWRETLLFTPGEELGLFEIEGWKLGVMTCADGYFPEVPRTLALRGAEVILYPNARGAIGPEADAAAVSDIVAVVVSNPIGHGGDGQRDGTSRIIIPPWGKTVAVAPGAKGEAVEGWIAQVFRHAEMVSWKAEACSIRPALRRPELYGPLVEGAKPSPAK
ncbi:MAG: carbon-nitrogen hydrolase family protein [Planctomycetota bacterium]|nr:carbon-nitrogen hydrolase family protein [Planctomycetota bacterium]